MTSTPNYEVEVYLTDGTLTRMSTGGTVERKLHAIIHCISTSLHGPIYVLHACGKS
jgi:hypothetical protein